MRTLALLLAMVVALAGEAAAEAPLAPRPFDVYTGVPPKRVISSSRVAGATATIELEPVLQGDVVHHEFVISNPGEAPLELSLPTMCSGCMLDGYSKRIEPGRVGHIRIVTPTDALGGQRVAGTIRVETSSPAMPVIEIDVGLTVREFAEISPYRVWLRGRVGEEIVATTTVVPNAAYPFEILRVRPRKGTWFSHETERLPDGSFRITLRNTRSKPGPYQDVLFVQTDHPARPEFKIRVEGRIEPASEDAAIPE